MDFRPVRNATKVSENERMLNSMPDFSMQKYWEATDVPPTELNVLRTQAPVLVQYYSPFCPNSQQSSKVTIIFRIFLNPAMTPLELEMTLE